MVLTFLILHFRFAEFTGSSVFSVCHLYLFILLSLIVCTGQYLSNRSPPCAFPNFNTSVTRFLFLGNNSFQDVLPQPTHLLLPLPTPPPRSPRPTHHTKPTHQTNTNPDHGRPKPTPRRFPKSQRKKRKPPAGLNPSKADPQPKPRSTLARTSTAASSPTSRPARRRSQASASVEDDRLFLAIASS